MPPPMGLPRGLGLSPPFVRGAVETLHDRSAAQPGWSDDAASPRRVPCSLRRARRTDWRSCHPSALRQVGEIEAMAWRPIDVSSP